MLNHFAAAICRSLIFVLLVIPAVAGALDDAPSITPSSLPRVGTVDARFLSYNIEMIEVTGGKFWKPYSSKPPSGSLPPPGTDSNLFEYRPPIDLANPRLRKLAAALAPAYLRVSGTWANTTYFADTGPSPAAPPAGFNSVLTRAQWRGVVEFSQAVDAPIVTSFAASSGTRDAGGVWTPDQARRRLAYTHAIGGAIAAAEFINEPNLTGLSGAPAGYDASAYGRDFAVFRRLVRQAAPETLILGPGTTGVTDTAADLLAASGSGLDAVSYHYYGALSARCGGGSSPESALSEQALSRTDRTLSFYQALRDRFEPGKPIWLTETAEAACGGNPSAATFLDTFRYLDQLGRLAQGGVKVVMHNTLAASDYGLLDERTRKPRPNYWGALLWRRLMGTTVLDAGVPPRSGLHVYAHCQRDTPGGVAVVVINTDRNATHVLALAAPSGRYTMDAANLLDADVRLNGRTLALDAGDALPEIAGVAVATGVVTFLPATITFLAIPGAGNSACR